MTTHIVTELADRLADPARVAATTDAPGNALRTDNGDLTLWTPVGLSDGHPALALLYAELSASDPGLREHTHAHLRAAIASTAPRPGGGLFGGLAAVAFAAHAAATESGGYQAMLTQFDQAISRECQALAARDRAKIADGQAIGGWSGYDVPVGITGVGRHLLARYQLTGNQAVLAALEDVLATLVDIALADDIDVRGRRMPAWWNHHDTAGIPADGGGHLNFGMAHGVGGPLALLALAWQAGVAVSRHDEAMLRILSLMRKWQLDDESGPFWPYSVTLDGPSPPGRYREVWCYGAAGIGRALFLAGIALDDASWRETAHDALRGAFTIALTGHNRIRDSGLCHGWAGLLQIASRMAFDTGDRYYTETADELAVRLEKAYTPEAPFGFRYDYPGSVRPLDRPGFLEGAAGIALALHCHATGRPPVTGWDAPLLIS
ncbi:lanthionine synthetase C family protein [Kibdelosporangium aridum]|uniref:lanthionine synthetase C family protein n=1 Tax=Kibdelosporangium aridum TaxID=2030 RepID=UPI000527BE6B